jgi:tungstate transport system substrate-binding protein
MPPLKRLPAAFLLLTLGLAACAPSAPTPEPQLLRLSTTTSTYDSGLLDAILPAFEKAYNARVDVVAVGTGQAVEIGKRGDADVILVHNRALEDAFVADGYGVERLPVMFNDFIIVGPEDDPAGIGEATTGSDAFSRIADSSSTFVSRGDDSGTNARELSLWKSAGLSPSAADAWYLSIGQGMGETLQFTEEKKAYTLSDRGTYLSMESDLPDLTILFGGQTIAENPDPAMRNPYGLIQVKPKDPQDPAAQMAARFVEWLTSLPTQDVISRYGVDKYRQPLFYPASEAWCAAHGDSSPGCSDS